MVGLEDSTHPTSYFLSRRYLIMGLLSTVKGWLNIGGVKVRMEGVNPMVSKSGNQLTGRLVLTSKSDKRVNKVDYKFVLSKTTGRGEDKETKEYIIGSSSHN